MTEEQSFAALLDANYEEPVDLAPGQKVDAVVVRVGRDRVFVDLGGKSEGILPLAEVTDPEGRITVNEGDNLGVYFLAAEYGEMRCTTMLGKGSASQSLLEEASRSGIPVEGVIDAEIKGGFAIKLAGSTMAFCPFSQIGLVRVESDEIVGRALDFRIMEYGENGRNIIVSHRQLVEEERRRQRAKLQETLSEGATVNGVVSAIRDFGAFVDIGGLDGLLPISEICWGHVEDIHERLRVGQKVEVMIMKLDWQAERFSFSLKNATPDPWNNAPVNYPEGSTHKGRVARLTNFGAFITMEEGVDGLAHISKLGGGRRINHPREVLENGQEVEVKIESVNLEDRRISLVLLNSDGSSGAETDDDGQAALKEFRQKKDRRKPGSMGTLGDLLAAKLRG
ncbi:MAG: 30S ribosomal protein S1 [Deltaproteobacteria bacterium]|nr:30S ribosomal protein S1 [Deltaproteobacteria bacterium]